MSIFTIVAGGTAIAWFLLRFSTAVLVGVVIPVGLSILIFEAHRLKRGLRHSLVCRYHLAAALLFLASATAPSAWAGDQPQWGQQYSRNMVSWERGLPDSCDPKSGRNVRWVAELGTSSYATPVVARGRVLIGTNNGNPRDPRHQGDRAVLMCLDEETGRLIWQLVVPKLPRDPYLDCPGVGLTSSLGTHRGTLWVGC